MTTTRDITVVMRSVGERTEELCYTLLAQQVPQDNIHVIRNMPLHASTRAVCEYAVEADRPYTVMIGADYIPLPTMLSTLHEYARGMSGDWLFVKGTIYDKTVMEVRGDSGGPMLYPTHILRQWLDILPTIENTVTTEASCQKHFYNLGYATHRGTAKLAYHNYEQEFRDLFRTHYIYGRKLRGLKRLRPRWKELSEEDSDFEVALYAYRQGMKMKTKPTADFRVDRGFSASPFANWQKEAINTQQFIEEYESTDYILRGRYLPAL